MKQALKYFILAVALVVPVLTYIFLKVFGVNHYAIPIYYQEQNDSLNIDGCLAFSIPHALDFKTIPGLEQIKIQADSLPVLVNVILDDCLGCPPTLNELKRILNSHQQIRIINIYSPAITEKVVEDQSASMGNQSVTLLTLIQLIRCRLLLDTSLKSSIDAMRGKNRVVLLDKWGRIRGYYDKDDRDDIDRLIMEISILKQE